MSRSLRTLPSLALSVASALATEHAAAAPDEAAAPEATAAAPGMAGTALTSGDWELQLAFGAETYQDSADEFAFDGLGSLSWAITDRLCWGVPFPSFSYRFGEAGDFELIPRAGLVGLGYSDEPDTLIGRVEAAVTAQFWLARELSASAYLESRWDFDSAEMKSGVPSRSDLLVISASVGVSWLATGWLTVSFAGGWEREAALQEVPFFLDSDLTFGALQAVAHRRLPLLELHLSPSFSLDAHASWSLSLRDAPAGQRYLFGFSWIF